MNENRVVVGVDGSEPSKIALRWAVLLAEATGASIEAIWVWSYPLSGGWATVPNGWDPEVDATKGLNQAIDEVFGPNRPQNLTLSVRQGYPAKVLIDSSIHARVLVVGSRGHGGFAGLLLGSVSANCAERARCPVLVVHGSDLPTSPLTAG
jgi:nucleotide-binding universal stress UspA family protein